MSLSGTGFVGKVKVNGVDIVASGWADYNDYRLEVNFPWMKMGNSTNQYHRSDPMYEPGFWASESKVKHRQWIYDRLMERSKVAIKNGKLRPDLHFVSLTGWELTETEWFLQHAPFFLPSQLIAVDYRKGKPEKSMIDPVIAKRLGVPKANCLVGTPLKNVLQKLRITHNVAVINADTIVATIEPTIRHELAPLITSFKRCYDKTGECFLFFNTVADIARNKKIAAGVDWVYKWLESRQIVEDYFSEPEYRNCEVLVPEWLAYQGHNTSTRMFCFCLHLNGAKHA